MTCQKFQQFIIRIHGCKACFHRYQPSRVRCGKGKCQLNFTCIYWLPVIKHNHVDVASNCMYGSIFHIHIYPPNVFFHFRKVFFFRERLHVKSKPDLFNMLIGSNGSNLLMLLDTFHISPCYTRTAHLFLFWVPDTFPNIGCKSFRSRSRAWPG